MSTTPATYRLVNQESKRRNAHLPSAARVVLAPHHVAEIRRIGVAELDRKISDMLAKGQVAASGVQANYATLRALAVESETRLGE
jgi:hypothetical protein